ncbi:hypothetical protein [Streptomyces sp. b94]|uniref:hypothetical protein n=1 Tax=Streptomyces sp. b94 TaxID=1827634 RepID=UPI00117ED800|nr:hypothetical protein [Streptomyces sp. b94]
MDGAGAPPAAGAESSTERSVESAVAPVIVPGSGAGGAGREPWVAADPSGAAATRSCGCGTGDGARLRSRAGPVSYTHL